MRFEDKYSVTDDKKIIISAEAFAIGESIQNLVNQLEHNRIDGVKNG